MPVSGEELLYVTIAFAAIGVVIAVIRRASNRPQVGRPAPGENRRRARARDTGAGRAEDRSGRPEGGEPGAAAGEAAEAGEGEGDSAQKAEAESQIADGAATKAEERHKIDQGLAKTRQAGFVARLGKLFARKQIDRDILDELEEVLFTADIGPKTADKLFQAAKTNLNRSELQDSSVVWTALRQASKEILAIDAAPVDFRRKRPFVLLILGVNGAGKTTTIGKLAAKLSGDGLKVLLAAGDTFRAAAVEQLEVWADRSSANIVKGKEGGDPSSVIFDAIKKGQDEDYDVVIADTAGRLHTKVDLMEELKKVGRVCDKALAGAPHETWLVLDATTGQNAIQQAEIFKEAMAVTGIVLTKLDGTAKGGVILGICDEMRVPVRFVGVGEQVEDLRSFDADVFVNALYGDGGEERAA